MSVYLITDTHFEHERLRLHCGRPEGYEETILGSISRMIRPEDVLIHLGDFCWRHDSLWHERYFSCAKSKNWLVIGNHDGKSAESYVARGWDWVGESCTLKIDGRIILFSHKPQAIPAEVDLNIHGHLHNSSEEDQRSNEPEVHSLITKRHILLAIEHTGYKPVSLKGLLKAALII